MIFPHGRLSRAAGFFRPREFWLDHSAMRDTHAQSSRDSRRGIIKERLVNDRRWLVIPSDMGRGRVAPGETGIMICHHQRNVPRRDNPPVREMQTRGHKDRCLLENHRRWWTVPEEFIKPVAQPLTSFLPIRKVVVPGRDARRHRQSSAPPVLRDGRGRLTGKPFEDLPRPGGHDPGVRGMLIYMASHPFDLHAQILEGFGREFGIKPRLQELRQ